MPPAARAPGRAGAEAFVRYYIDLLNYSGATGDTSTFSAASQRCESCNKLAGNFRRTYRDGGYYRTKGWRVNTVFASEVNRDHYTAVAEVKETPIEWQVVAGGPIRTLPEDKVNLRFSVLRASSRWLITELTRS